MSNTYAGVKLGVKDRRLVEEFPELTPYELLEKGLSDKGYQLLIESNIDANVVSKVEKSVGVEEDNLPKPKVEKVVSENKKNIFNPKVSSIKEAAAIGSHPSSGLVQLMNLRTGEVKIMSATFAKKLAKTPKHYKIL